jgi:hypothetical protein
VVEVRGTRKVEVEGIHGTREAVRVSAVPERLNFIILG